MDNRFERCVKEYRQEQERYNSRGKDIDMDNRFTRLVESEKRKPIQTDDSIRKWSMDSQNDTIQRNISVSTTSPTTVYLSSSSKSPSSPLLSPLSTSSLKSNITKKNEPRKWNNSRLRSNTISDFPQLEKKENIKEVLKESINETIIPQSISAPPSPMILPKKETTLPKRILYPKEIEEIKKDTSDMTHIISIRKGRTVSHLVDLNINTNDNENDNNDNTECTEDKKYGKWSEIFTENKEDWGTMCL
jgi:hypothetical protein